MTWNQQKNKTFLHFKTLVHILKLKKILYFFLSYFLLHKLWSCKKISVHSKCIIFNWEIFQLCTFTSHNPAQSGKRRHEAGRSSKEISRKCCMCWRELEQARKWRQPKRRGKELKFKRTKVKREVSRPGDWYGWRMAELAAVLWAGQGIWITSW